MNKYKEGIAYFNEGKFDEALRVFKNLITEDPSNSSYVIYHGRILSRMGAYDKALEDFDQLLRLEPENTSFISDRAVVLYLLQRNEESLAELDRALSMDPGNPYRYASRAFLKDRTGDLKGAIADYEKAIEMDPEDAISINNKGMVEEKLGYKDQANQSFRDADALVRYNPNRPQSPPVQETELREEIQQELEEESEKGMSLSSYFSTVGEVFTNQNTRNEFLKFVSKRFKGKDK